MIRRIQEVHSEWDLNFLTDEDESPDAKEHEKNERVEPSTKEDDRCDPNSTEEGGSS